MHWSNQNTMKKREKKIQNLNPEIHEICHVLFKILETVVPRVLDLCAECDQILNPLIGLIKFWIFIEKYDPVLYFFFIYLSPKPLKDAIKSYLILENVI